MTMAWSGAAAFDAAEDRKVRLLRARGYNAVRPSHNPFSDSFLNACDRHGMMVIAETFDCWTVGKNPQDYATVFAAQWQDDLTRIISSQRNHPAIVMWSIGNEIPNRNLKDGIAIQWQLANTARRLDPTRPVTAAINDFPGQPVIPSAQAARAGTAGVADYASTVFLDIVGYNYKLDAYQRDHARFPNRVIVGTESFPKDVFAIWDQVERSPYVLGDFVWTAMDYLGEAGIGGATYSTGVAPTGMGLSGRWPNVVSACGDLDLIGNQKAASLARDVAWGLSDLEVAVQKPLADGVTETIHPWGWSDERPGWTWPGAEGKNLPVRLYTTGDRVEVTLNGATVANRQVTPADRKHVEVCVPYAPGTLAVTAFRGGHELARRQWTTAGLATKIRLMPESRTGGAGRGDLTYIAIEIQDANGRHAGDIAKNLSLKMSGPAELAGFGSADPNANAGYRTDTTTTFDGRALIILRGAGRPGTVSISVGGDRLVADVLTLQFA